MVPSGVFTALKQYVDVAKSVQGRTKFICRMPSALYARTCGLRKVYNRRISAKMTWEEMDWLRCQNPERRIAL
jgi:hypothetical protein